MDHHKTGTNVPPLASRGVTDLDQLRIGIDAYADAHSARPRRGWLRRFLACLSLSFCALLWADSASWATTPPPDGSPSASPSSEPSSTSPDPSSPPEPELSEEPPAPAESTLSEDTPPTVVQLETEQMAVLLLSACVSALCLPALVVLGYGNRG